MVPEDEPSDIMQNKESYKAEWGLFVNATYYNHMIHLPIRLNRINIFSLFVCWYL